MRNVLARLSVAVLLSLPTVFAQNASPPTVDVNALSMQEGTISDYLLTRASSTDTAADPLCYEKSSNMSTDFNCLTQALKATGLNETLAGEGPYTVFAPTDEAFQSLAAGMSSADWKALFTDSEALKSLLSYHVLPKKLSLEALRMAADATTGDVSEATVQGADVGVHFARAAEGESVTTVTVGAAAPQAVDSPHVVGETVDLSNGVVIPINHVLSVPNA